MGKLKIHMDLVQQPVVLALALAVMEPLATVQLVSIREPLAQQPVRV
jgi:hypothetical protein